MIDWLATPIDPSRLHTVADAVAWHGRLMTLSWGVLLPLGIVVARFFKIMPRQNWPAHVDNRFWWRSHLSLQYTGSVLMLIGLLVILMGGSGGTRWQAHGLLGYTVVALGICQILGGWLRGSKGGPTDEKMRGDHYDMTRHRLIFEWLHKSLGYAALMLGIATIVTGLWHANGPRWMWLSLGAWWSLLLAIFIALQRQGRAFDTYQAIWGPDPRHPGNRMKPTGWGVRRPTPSPGE